MVKVSLFTSHQSHSRLRLGFTHSGKGKSLAESSDQRKAAGAERLMNRQSLITARQIRWGWGAREKKKLKTKF